MRLALDEARKGLGRTSPNPPVGAVLVKDGTIVGVGHHAEAGGPHAEVMALQRAGADARGADLYVTLEPCNHQGKTPPCAPAVVAAGVARAFVASMDPNPLVSGRGVQQMRDGGLEVEVGLLGMEADHLIEGWAKFITTGLPFVTLKVASTLDGRIATSSGDSQWITGEEARGLVHRLRSQVDAVIVGRGTVEADDPRLDARVPGGHNPLRIVLDSSLQMPTTARMLGLPGRTWVACVDPPDPEKARALGAAGAEIFPCLGRDGQVDLDDLLRRLAARGVAEVLVEGGAGVFGAFLAAEHCDKLWLHLGPKVFGGGPTWTSAPDVAKVAQAPGFVFRHVEQVGEDLLIEARLASKESVGSKQEDGRR